MRRPVEWLVAVGLLLVAGTAVAVAPQEGTIADPFSVRGELGEVVTTRMLEVEVQDVRLAEELDLAYAESGLSTDGVWVVMDVTVMTRLEAASIAYTELHIGEQSFRMQSLPYPALEFLAYGSGVPVHGTIAFEVPTSAIESAAARIAEVHFTTNFLPQLDDIAVIDVDLGSDDPAIRTIVDPPFVVEVR